MGNDAEPVCDDNGGKWMIQCGRACAHVDSITGRKNTGDGRDDGGEELDGH